MSALLAPGCAGDDVRDAPDDTGGDIGGATVTPISRGSTLPDFTGHPLPLAATIALESGFGPRRMPLEDGREDFHLGLDYDAPEGEPVYAIADGTAERVDAGGEDDGNTLYVAHPVTPFTWHDTTITTLYAVYSHLASFDVSEGDPVRAGQQVGAVGDTGAAVEAHLHFEIRVGTRCTLRYMTEHPDSTCGLGFDPAINPYHLVAGSVPDGLDVTVLSADPYTLRVRTSDTDIDLNRIATDLGTVDFDLREGLDPTTYALLNDLDYGWMHLVPDLPDDEPAHQSYTLTFPTRPAWVEVLDFRGEGWRIEP